MAQKLPLTMILPEIPNAFAFGKDVPSVDVNYARKLHEALRSNNISIASRIEELIEAGTFAQRPTATGADKIYYATDVQKLYMDINGTWVDISGDENIDGGVADSVYLATQRVDGGTA